MNGIGREILLVRHGRAADGAARRVQRATSPLVPRGRAEARAVARELARRFGRLPRVWTSDLVRARETARVAARALGARVVPAPAFREIRLGPWEGLRIEDLEAASGAVLARWRRDARRPPRGIEPLARFRDRLLSGLEAILDASSGPVVVVTHGGAISVLLSRFLGLPLRNVAQVPAENGSISRLWREGDRTYVSSFNETGHLRETS